MSTPDNEAVIGLREWEIRKLLEGPEGRLDVIIQRLEQEPIVGFSESEKTELLQIKALLDKLFKGKT